MEAKKSEQRTLPLDTWYLIISKRYLSTSDLCCMALVTTDFRELAQRNLFEEVSFRYHCWDSAWEKKRPGAGFRPDWASFKKKIDIICNSPRICRHVRWLRIVACCPMPLHSIYTPFSDLMHSSYTRLSEPVFASALEEQLAPALLTMVNLRRIYFKAPFMLENFHQAILLHPTLERLVTTPITLCRRPCSKHKQISKARIQELQLVDWNLEESFSGYEPTLIGPRPCALTTHILITHQSSLQALIITLPLLHQAMIGAHPTAQFPQLRRFSIFHLRSPWSMPEEETFGRMLSSLISFVATTHTTMRDLHWKCDVPLSSLGNDWSWVFPVIETLEGGPEVEALLSSHPLKCLAFRGGSEGDSQTTALSLRQCRKGSPHLARLNVKEVCLSQDIAEAISQFDYLAELTYQVTAGVEDLVPELRDINSDEEAAKARLMAMREFLNIFLPDLPRLCSLSVIMADCERSFFATADTIVEIFSFLRSNSLRMLKYKSLKPRPVQDMNRPMENQTMELQWVTGKDEERYLVPGKLVTSKPGYSCAWHMQNCDETRCPESSPIWFGV